MLEYETLKRYNPQFFREMGMLLLGVFRPEFLHRNFYKWQKFRKFTMKGLSVRFVEKGGWHFSYLGGVNAIIKKIESFAHNEYNKPEFKNPEKIKQLITSGEDLFGRGFKYQFLNIDANFPEYLQKNKERYKQFIFER
jgi:beta-1,4-mannosyl-glycoprotein beta-1,4-N-acetylglucosaminyltransferase